MRLLRDGEDAPLHGEACDVLADLGASRGHRIGLVTGNDPLAVQAHVAARRNGWTLVPLVAGPSDLVQAAATAGACDAVLAVRGLGAEGTRDLPLVVADASGGTVASTPAVLQDADPSGPAYVLHSSGTTGRPKPVPITWAQLDAHAAAASRRLADTASSAWAATLRFRRVGGVAMLHRALANGSTLLLDGLPALDQATHVSLVPTQLSRLLAERGRVPEGLRCLLLGGDHAPESLVRPALDSGWPIFCTYGMTETCSQAATALPRERLERPGTSGRALDGVHIEAVDGELVVSGPTVVGGRHATGDLGRVDAEGFVFVAGRRDDRITTGGEKVDPVLVEEVLCTHPAVAEAGVVGLPDPDWGQRVVAAVVLRGPMPDLKPWCRSRLEPAQVPKAFVAAGALPRNEAGKLQRAILRQRLQTTVPT